MDVCLSLVDLTRWMLPEERMYAEFGESTMYDSVSLDIGMGLKKAQSGSDYGRLWHTLR